MCYVSLFIGYIFIYTVFVFCNYLVIQSDLCSIGCLDPKTFKEFKLVKRTQLSHNVAKFRFELPTPTSVLGLPIGQHMSCRFDGCLVYCFQIHLLPDQKSEIYFSHC